jgi:translation initiation factor IF-1
MSAADAFQVEGVVLEVLSERTCWVGWANGHRLVGFLTRRRQAELGPPRLGQRLVVQVSPYDLSEGRIVSVSRNLINESSRISQETL